MKRTTRLMAVILAVITILSVVPTTAFAASPSFTDVPQNAWYYEPVTYMAENGYMSGTGDNKFSPNLTTTRAMFVTVLGRIAEIDTTAYTNTSFNDVAVGTWYAPYVEWAAKNNIVSGTGNNRFSPNDYVTREQAAVILFNYLKKDYTLTLDSTFLDNAPDGASVSSWALDAMKWATSAALMRGDNNGTLRPKYSATRAEIATIFKRFIEIKADLDAGKPDVPGTCDHVWEVSKREDLEVVPAKSFVKAEWAQIPNYRGNQCNGCDINFMQWYIDNAYDDYNHETHDGNRYHTCADLYNKLDDWQIDNELSEEGGIGCTGGQGSNHLATMPLTTHLLVPKTYSAGIMTNVATEEECTRCGKTRAVNNCDLLCDSNWVANEESYVICAAWDEILNECKNGTYTGNILDTIHHPDRVNTKIVSYTNTVTGDTVNVEMTSCVHDGNKNWTQDWSSGMMTPDDYICPDCGVTRRNVSRETCLQTNPTIIDFRETRDEYWARVHPDHNNTSDYYGWETNKTRT